MKALKVLIVDDNREIAQSLAALIRLQGHEAQVANDARAGLRLAVAAVPDLIIHDIGLPDMSGYDAARRLRALDCLRDVVLVAHTANCTEHDQRQAREAGFDQYLAKPMDPAFLSRILSRISSTRVAPKVEVSA